MKAPRIAFAAAAFAAVVADVSRRARADTRHRRRQPHAEHTDCREDRSDGRQDT